MENSSAASPLSGVRQWGRYPVDVRIAVKRNRGSQQLVCRTTDIGQGGMGMMSPAMLQVGEVVDLEVTLPGSDAMLKLRAVVRDESGARFGVEFLSLTDLQRREIELFGRRTILQKPVS